MQTTNKKIADDLRQENDSLRRLRRDAEDRGDMTEAQHLSDKIMANWRVIGTLVSIGETINDQPTQT